MFELFLLSIITPETLELRETKVTTIFESQELCDRAGYGFQRAFNDVISYECRPMEKEIYSNHKYDRLVCQKLHLYANRAYLFNLACGLPDDSCSCDDDEIPPAPCVKYDIND